MYIKKENRVKVFSLDSVAWEPYGPGDKLRRKVFHSENMTFVMSKLPGGSRFNGHSHPQEQITFVIEGCLDFECGGEYHMLPAGSVIVIPPDMHHTPNVASEEDAVCIEVFYPQRDFPESEEFK